MIRFLSIALLASLGLAQSSPAVKITDNQQGVWYTAELNSGPGNLSGFIGILSDVKGNGVRVSYDFKDFNLTDSLEYSYHIHEKPVPSDGNCNSTGAHFDKYNVGDDHVCDKKEPETCQLGDLSGKHGAITFAKETSNNSRADAYQDEYLSTTINNTAFFGALSIVVHRKKDKFRLACGNFALFQMPEGNSSLLVPQPTGSAGLYPNSTSTTVVATMTVDASNTVGPVKGSATHIGSSSSSTRPTSSTGVQTGGNIGRKSEVYGAFVVGVAAMAILL